MNQKQLEQLYINEQKSLKEIARIENLSFGYIWRLLKKYKIPTRNSKIASNLYCSNNPDKRRKYNINDTYFSVIDCSEKAYWLGFLTADGCVRNNYRLQINLQHQDRSHLELFKKHLNSEAPIHYAKINNSVLLKVSSTSIIKDLTKYGVIKHKTKGIVFPDINKLFLKDFIRGYIDGDGWVGNYKSGFTVGVCSVSEKIIKQIIHYFIENKIIENSKKIQKRKNVYSVSWTNKKARQIYSFLYYENCIALERKRNIYKPIK